jgi:hypothetical protein
MAVSLCAAIAMVLGAMSVGATIPFGSSPESTEAQPSGQRSSITPEDIRARAQLANPALLPSNSLTRQQVLTPNSLKKSPPLLLNPSRPQIDVSLGPINTLINNDKIQLKVNVPVLTPLIPAPEPVVEIPDPVPVVEEVIEEPVPPPSTEEPEEAFTPMMAPEESTP